MAKPGRSAWNESRLALARLAVALSFAAGFVKQVVAIVKPYLAEKALEAVRDLPLDACTVREVKGYGRQKSYLDEYRGSEYSSAYLPKVEIVSWVEEEHVEQVVRAIVEVTRTGRMGDGKVFVLPSDSGLAPEHEGQPPSANPAS